ncbi:hypothetical protein F4803DRAFT_554953 [Xylaria telfairii]|nr:hypothetical protein F4803DRAFT_554953 [Xylaria telfairii]
MPALGKATSMNIPGHYYDAEKKRYFKVENSKTAPTNAAWASNNVKRRKLHEEDTATALRHLDLAKNRITRARVLHEPLTGGFFAREYGAMKDDMQAACFVDGLTNKGTISLSHPGAETHGWQVKRMCVAGDDHKTGLCPVLNQHLLRNYRLPEHNLPWVEAYIPQISDIKYHAPSNCMLVTSRQPFIGNSLNSLWALQPNIDHDNEDPLRPRWLLPSGMFPLRISVPLLPFSFIFRISRIVLLSPTSLCTQISPLYDYQHSLFTPALGNIRPLPIRGIGRHDEAHCIAPAPESSQLVCLVGTSRGVVQRHCTLGNSSWLTPPTNPKRQSQSSLFGDVFTIDFHPSQTEILRFGGRPGALFTADIRIRHASWSHLKLPSTITHLKCLDGGNQVLVAGLENQLGVYDLRFVRSFRGAEDGSVRVNTGSRDGERRSTYHDNRPHNSQRGDFRSRSRNEGDGWADKNTGKWGNNAVAQPVIKFEHYQNSADIDIGFAYDTETGTVAAAHDVPGTVLLYSVRTGSSLRVLDFATEGKTNGRSGHPLPILDADREQTRRLDLPVIRSLQFHTFPGDHTPTLFVANDRRAGITAFSFGVDDLGDEA